MDHWFETKVMSRSNIKIDLMLPLEMCQQWRKFDVLKQEVQQWVSCFWFWNVLVFIALSFRKKSWPLGTNLITKVLDVYSLPYSKFSRYTIVPGLRRIKQIKWNTHIKTKYYKTLIHHKFDWIYLLQSRHLCQYVFTANWKYAGHPMQHKFHPWCDLQRENFQGRDVITGGFKYQYLVRKTMAKLTWLWRVRKVQ